MTPIAPLITPFLREHMPRERGYSPHTCETYAHAFRLLFVFASERLGQRPSQLCLEHIDARTNDNGKRIQVQGTTAGGKFTLSSPTAAHGDCVRSFAYWDRAALDQLLVAHRIPVNDPKPLGL